VVERGWGRDGAWWVGEGLCRAEVVVDNLVAPPPKWFGHANKNKTRRGCEWVVALPWWQLPGHCPVLSLTAVVHCVDDKSPIVTLSPPPFCPPPLPSSPAGSVQYGGPEVTTHTAYLVAVTLPHVRLGDTVTVQAWNV